MAGKSEFLQIRVSPWHKEQLRRNAKAAGMDVSAYVLARAVPEARQRFSSIIAALRRGGKESFQLAALNDFLSALSVGEFNEAVEAEGVQGLSLFHANYVAAMIELAAHGKGITPPEWTKTVGALDAPWFATTLPGLRAYLLHVSPVPFKRRNIFIDASIGDRV